jgi:hypothetical protein
LGKRERTFPEKVFPASPSPFINLYREQSIFLKLPLLSAFLRIMRTAPRSAAKKHQKIMLFPTKKRPAISPAAIILQSAFFSEAETYFLMAATTCSAICFMPLTDG